MAVHTPEPWTIYRGAADDSDFGLAIVAGASHPKLCIALIPADGDVVFSPDGVLDAEGLPVPEALLNAALIVTSPQLLAAAEAVLEAAYPSAGVQGSAIVSYGALAGLARAVKAARGEEAP